MSDITLLPPPKPQQRLVVVNENPDERIVYVAAVEDLIKLIRRWGVGVVTDPPVFGGVYQIEINALYDFREVVDVIKGLG